MDLTLLTGFGEEEIFAQALLDSFTGRTANAMEFVLRNRVLLVKASNGAPLDISFGAFPFEERVVRRATLFEFAPGYVFPTCSAEDLIVMKSFAGRPRDWQDVEMIKVRQKNRINWKLVLREIQPLAMLKETPEIVERLSKLAKS